MKILRIKEWNGLDWLTVICPTIGFILLFCALAMGGELERRVTTIYMPNDNYPTVQDALYADVEGEKVIKLRKGFVSEEASLSILEPVTFSGDGEIILTHNLYIYEAGSVVIEDGVKITSLSPYLPAISSYDSDLILTDCEIFGSQGVFVFGGEKIVVKNNNIRCNNSSSVTAKGLKMFWIEVDAEYLVEGNRFHGFAIGIQSNFAITPCDNRFNDNEFINVAVDSDSLSMREWTQFRDSNSGITFMYPADQIIGGSAGQGHVTLDANGFSITITDYFNRDLFNVTPRIRGVSINNETGGTLMELDYEKFLFINRPLTHVREVIISVSSYEEKNIEGAKLIADLVFASVQSSPFDASVHEPKGRKVVEHINLLKGRGTFSEEEAKRKIAKWVELMKKS